MSKLFEAVGKIGIIAFNNVVKHQKNFDSNNTTGYDVTYDEGKRLWNEHKYDGKAKSVLDSFWRFASADGWNSFADGYDDAKNADGIEGRGPRRRF